MLCLTTGRIEAASAIYQRCISMDNNNFRAIATLATAYHSLGLLTEASDLYNIAAKQEIESKGGNIILLINYAKLLLQVNNSVEAKNVLTEAEKIDSNNDELKSLMKMV